MKTMTESQFNAIPQHMRGIWIAERTNIAGWELVRDQYIGKRTMITEVNDVEILVEGINFRIVPDVPRRYRGWLIGEGFLGYSASSPDYDASYEGPEDGWVTSGKSVDASSIEELMDSIDEAMDEECPTCTLSNGLKVLNFSSAHSFQFADGTILDACDEKRANEMKLNAVEVVERSGCGRFDKISLKFEMSTHVMNEIEYLRDARVDVVLCPLPVIELLRKQQQPESGPLFAGIRKIDRVSGLIHIDRFCV